MPPPVDASAFVIFPSASILRLTSIVISRVMSAFRLRGTTGLTCLSGWGGVGFSTWGAAAVGGEGRGVGAACSTTGVGTTTCGSGIGCSFGGAGLIIAGSVERAT